MVDVPAKQWSLKLRSIIAKEATAADMWIHEYLRCEHGYVIGPDGKYKWRIQFSDPLDEVAFRLKYSIE